MNVDKNDKINYFYTQNTNVGYCLLNKKSAQKVFSKDLVYKENFSIIESHKMDAV